VDATRPLNLPEQSLLESYLEEVRVSWDRIDAAHNAGLRWDEVKAAEKELPWFAEALEAFEQERDIQLEDKILQKAREGSSSELKKVAESRLAGYNKRVQVDQRSATVTLDADEWLRSMKMLPS
jgi:hypothetical protein